MPAKVPYSESRFKRQSHTPAEYAGSIQGPYRHSDTTWAILHLVMILLVILAVIVMVYFRT